MKTKIISLAVSTLCVTSIATLAYAEDYYSNQTPNGSGYSSSNSTNSGYSSSNSGYSSSNSTGTSTSTNYYSQKAPAPAPQKEHKKHKNKFSFSINVPGQTETIVVTNHGVRPRFIGPQWISMRTGEPLPSDVVIGGGQPVPPATLYVCHAFYRGGLHPGKWYQGRCNISWGGNEISLSRYEVLASNEPLRWVPASYGAIPAGAVEGGYENHRPLFVCQADYHGGRHTGKVVGQSCNFGWGGSEITVPYYNVLVR